MRKLPGAIVIIDPNMERTAVKEAKVLGIPVVGLVDTNSDPNQVDFPIPGNDDASKSISLITDYLTNAIKEGLDERKKNKAEKDSAA